MRRDRKTLREIVAYLHEKYEVKTTISSLNGIIKSYLRKPDPFGVGSIGLSQVPAVPQSSPVVKEENDSPAFQGIPEPKITDWRTRLRAAHRKATFNEIRFFKENATPEQLEVHRQIISSKPQEEYNFLCYQMEAAPNLYQDNHND